jgi:aspartyl aminopeptidase
VLWWLPQEEKTQNIKHEEKKGEWHFLWLQRELGLSGIKCEKTEENKEHRHTKNKNIIRGVKKENIVKKKWGLGDC